MNNLAVQQGDFAEQVLLVAHDIAGDISITRTKELNVLVKEFEGIATQVLEELKETSTFTKFFCLSADSVVRGDSVEVLLLFNNDLKKRTKECFLKKSGQRLRYKYHGIEGKLKPSVCENEKELTVRKPFLGVTFRISAQQLVHQPLDINDSLSLKYHRARLALSDDVGEPSFRLLRYFKNLRAKPWSLVDDWMLKLLTHSMSQVEGSTMGQVMERMVNFFRNVHLENVVQDLLSGQLINVVKQEDIHSSIVKSQAYLNNVNLFQAEHVNKAPVPYPGDPDQAPQAPQVAQAIPGD